MVRDVPLSNRRRDITAVVFLGLIGVGIPLWLAASAGAIGLPTIDDWVYMRGAENLFRDGRLVMGGHSAASIGQLLLVQPLLWVSGGDPWAFTAFGLVMTFVGLAATYLLARRFIGTGSAILVVLLLEAVPGFARISVSFMTDIPACSLAILCLLLGTIWLDQGRRSVLVATLVVGLLGVSIREFALAAPVTILVAGWARSRPGERTLLMAASGLFVAGFVAILLGAGSADRGVGATSGGLEHLILIGPAFTTLAAVVLPALALGIGGRMRSLRPEHLVLGFGLVGLVLVMPYGPIVGGLWMSNGVVGNALLSGTRDPVIGDPGWGLSQQLALFAGSLMAALCIGWISSNLRSTGEGGSAMTRALRILRGSDGVLILFVVLNAAELVAFAGLGGILDRYLLPIVPVAAILLLGGQGPSPIGRRHALAHGALAWLAISSALVTTNSFAYDSARWRAGQAAVALGYSPEVVDAGYEWVGYHTLGGSIGGDGLPYRSWYYEIIPAESPCAVISNGTIVDPGVVLIHVDAAAYRQYLFFGPEQPLYLFGATSAGCAPTS